MGGWSKWVVNPPPSFKVLVAKVDATSRVVGNGRGRNGRSVERDQCGRRDVRGSQEKVESMSV